MTSTVSAPAKRHANRCPVTGRFVKATVSAPVVAAPAPVVVPVIDDVPAVSAPVVETAPVVRTVVRSAPVLRDRSGFLALALFVLALVATAVFVVMPGPQASASVERTPAVHGANHAAFRLGEARSMHLATCDRLSGKGDDGWYVEAARLTAETGARYTARSLAVSCALASVVRPVVRP